MEKLSTPLGSSYWSESGAYQADHDRLWEALVPANGPCQTVNGELVRAIGRLIYEHCNNGNCNAVETDYSTCSHCGGSCEGNSYEDEDGEEVWEDCSWCDGTGEEEGDIYITEMYDGFLDFIESRVPGAPVDNLREFMLSGMGCNFGDEEMHLYNAVADAVLYHVLTTEDSPL
jgi:hypothetical protein